MRNPQVFFFSKESPDIIVFFQQKAFFFLSGRGRTSHNNENKIAPAIQCFVRIVQNPFQAGKELMAGHACSVNPVQVVIPFNNQKSS